MTEIAESAHLANANLDRTWEVFQDTRKVAACIPGLVITSDDGEGNYQGEIVVQFGPTKVKFRGEANLSYDDAEHSITIEGRGIDGRGASRATAGGLVRLLDAQGGCDLDVKGEFNVSGPLESFANTGGIHIARLLIAEFTANLAKLDGIADERQPVGETDRTKQSAPTQEQPKSIKAHALVWALIVSLFGNLQQRIFRGVSK